MPEGSSTERSQPTDISAVIEEICWSFDAAWQSRQVPRIEEALVRARAWSAAERRLLLAELVAIDLHHRWSAAASSTHSRQADTPAVTAPWQAPPSEPGVLPPRPRLEDYLSCYPELGPAEELSPNLILEEYLRRQEAGESPTHDEYLARFPRQAAALGALLLAADATALTVQSADETAKIGPGQTFGKYELLRKLGSGGMGTVYLARDTELNRQVAIKVPRFDRVGGELQRRRFLREARSAARLRHPHLCSIHDIQHDPVTFIVYDYVEGQTLRAWMTGRQVTGRQAAALVAKLARGVAFAHTHGVIHRDIKPGNVMIEAESGDPVLMDFGLARELTGAGEELTQAGDVIGTPAYMSPEQAAGRSHEVDARSDVYALGAVLYELVSGQRPFEGSLAEILVQVQFEEPRRLRSIAPRTHRDLETICLKAMARDRSVRYQTAEALAEDLERFEAGEPILARRQSWLARLSRPVRRRPGLAAAFATAFAVLVIAALLVASAARQSRVNQLWAAVEAGLAADDWEAADLEAIETNLKRLEPLNAERVGQTRERLYQLLAGAIRRRLDEPRLEAGAVEPLRMRIGLLEARAPEAATAMREMLDRRLAQWETVLDLAPPFAGADVSLKGGPIRAGEGRLILGDGTRDVHMTTVVACAASAEIEGHFSGDWRSNSRLGLRLNVAAEADYTFTLRVASQREAGRLGDERQSAPATLAAAAAAGHPYVLEITRVGIRLARQRIGNWQLPSGPLVLRARREGNILTFSAGETNTVVFEDMFPLSQAVPGEFAVAGGKEVSLSRLIARRQRTPAQPSALEKADELFHARGYSEALRLYEEGGQRLQDAALRQEAQYKRGLCLFHLSRPAEAAECWAHLFGETGSRWPPLAGCQLLMLRLAEGRRDDADLLFENLVSRFPASQVALLLPVETRQRIVEAYSRGEEIHLTQRKDAQRRAVQELERLRSLQRYWDHGQVDFELWFRLLLAYWAAGQPEQALRVGKEMIDAYGTSYLDGPEPVDLKTHKYYCWILQQARGAEVALREIDRLLFRPSRQYRPAALMLRPERARALCAAGRTTEAEKELLDYIALAPIGTNRGLEITDAHLLLGLFRREQGDEAGALAYWRDGLRRVRTAGPGGTEALLKNVGGGTHLLYYLIAASLVDDVRPEDVDVAMTFLQTAIPSQASMLGMMRSDSFRRQFFPADALQRLIARAWRTSDGYRLARQLVLHEVGRGEHTRLPLLLLFREFTLQNAFGDTIVEEQSQLVDQMVAGVGQSYLQGHLQTAHVLAGFMAWNGQMGALGWSSVQQRFASERPLRAALAYVFAHRMLRLKNPEAAKTLLAAAAVDAPPGSPLAEAIAIDRSLLEAKKARLRFTSDFPESLDLQVTRDGAVVETVPVREKTEIDLPEGEYRIASKRGSDVQLSAQQVRLFAGQRGHVDARWRWKPGVRWGIGGLVPQPARLNRLGHWQVLLRFPADPNRVSFSADGKQLAISDVDSVRVYTMPEGKLGQVLLGGSAALREGTFSPDGRWLVAPCADGTIHRWDVATGKSALALPSQGGGASICQFSPDGQRLAVAYAGNVPTIGLWNSEGNLINKVQVPGRFFSRIAWTADSQLFATVADEPVLRVWDRNGKAIGTIEQRLPLRAPAWSPDGGLLAAAVLGGGRTGPIQVWEDRGRKLLATLNTPSSWLHALSFSPDGKYLVAPVGGIWRWTVPQWKTKPLSFSGISANTEIRSVAWHPDGKQFAATLSDGRVQFWDVESGKPQGSLGEVGGRGAIVYPSPAATSAGLVVAGSKDVWLLDATGRPQLLSAELTSTLPPLAWSPKGDHVALLCAEKSVQVWKVSGASATPVSRWDHAGRRSIAWSPDGRRLAVAGNGGDVHVCSAAGERLRTLATSEPWIRRIAWASAGQRLLAWGAHHLEAWSWESGRLTSEKHDDQVLSWEPSPDGSRLATGWQDGSIRLYDSDGRLVKKLDAHRAPARLLAWSPDGKQFASRADPPDQRLRVWDADGRPGPTLERNCTASQLAWSGNGRLVAMTESSGDIFLLDVSTGQPRPSLRRHSGWASGVCFLGDNRVLSHGHDRVLRCWDPASGQLSSVTVILPGGRAARIGQGGNLETYGQDVEKSLVYVVEQPDGSTRCLTPGEFRQQIVENESRAN